MRRIASHHLVNRFLRNPVVEQFADALPHSVDRIRISALSEIGRNEAAFGDDFDIVQKFFTALPFELRIAGAGTPEARQIAVLHKCAETDRLFDLVLASSSRSAS